MGDGCCCACFWTALAVVVVMAIAYLLRSSRLLRNWGKSVDRTTTKNGGDLVAKVLKAHRVDHVFTLVGGHISPILAGCEREGIRVVDTRHEVSAVFAADAYARLTRNVGVAAVTAGPGVTNTITAVKNAQMAESPVLLFGGAAASLAKGRGALQDIDQMTLLKPLCKYAETITTVNEIIPIVTEAIHTACSGTPGPVFVEMPLDTLYPYITVADEFLSKLKKTTIMQKVVSFYLNKSIDLIFGGAFDDTTVSVKPPLIPTHSPNDVSTFSSILAKAKRPVFVFGSQATLPPADLGRLVAAVEKLGVPCFLGGMSRGLLGANSPLHIRHNRTKALRQADFVYLCGAVADFRLDYGRSLPKSPAGIVVANRSKANATLNSPFFWKATLSVVGDPAQLLIDVADRAASKPCMADDWLSSLKLADATRDAEIETKANAEVVSAAKATAVGSPVGEPLNPLKLLIGVRAAMRRLGATGERQMIIADGGDFVGSAAYILKPDGPLTWLDPGAFGTLGVGAGFMIGTRAAFPNARIWAIFGDGSFGYSLADFDTLNRFDMGAKVVAVVGNDSGWNQITRAQVPMLKTDVACMLARDTRYELAAGALGAEGVVLTADAKSTAAKTREDEAPFNVELEGRKNALVVNCIIGKSDFREGSISV